MSAGLLASSCSFPPTPQPHRGRPRASVPWLVLCLLSPLAASNAAGEPTSLAAALPHPVPLIFETDLSGDCDDVGALAMIHHHIGLREADLLMIGVNRDEPTGSSAAAIDAINTYYGHGDIPIGTSHTGRSQTPRRSPYAATLAREFPHDARPDREMPDAVALYRRTLAAAGDSSVVIVSVGGTTNLADLLDSPPDAVSSLDGTALVAQKVNRLVQMAGQFPDSRVRRAEANMLIDPPGNRAVAERWPTPVVWSGWEVGAGIRTGQALQPLPATNPVRRAYELHPGGGIADDGRKLSSLQRGRPSWDQTAVLYGVRGAGPWFRVVPGRVVLGDASKHTSWQTADEASGETRHAHLQLAVEPAVVAATIDGLMQPAGIEKRPEMQPPATPR